MAATRQGDSRDDDASGLLPEVYERLLAAARRHFERQAPGQTLQPTALVHEAYLKIVNADSASWTDRAHFLALASKAMRQVLIDAARARNRQRRGGEWSRITLDAADREDHVMLSIDLLDLNDALDELERYDARQARIVEMHFLGGMTFNEIALALDMPLREARSDWYMARAWLRGRLSENDAR